MSMTKTTAFYEMESEFSIDPSFQSLGTPSMVLASNIFKSGTVEKDSMLVVPVQNGKGFKDNLSADDLYISVRTFGASNVIPRLVWRQTSKTLRFLSSAVTFLIPAGTLLAAVRFGLSFWSASGKQKTLMLVSPGYALAKVAFDTYGSIYKNYTKIVSPEDLRNDIDLDRQKDPKNAAKNYPDDPTFYPVEFSPGRRSDGFLNPYGGSVVVSDKKNKAGEFEVADQSVRNAGYAAGYHYVSNFTLDFFQPIPIETVVKLVQMLDVQPPRANGKTNTAFTKTKASAEQLSLKNVLEPLNELIGNMIQFKALERAKKRTGPGSFNIKNIDEDKNPIYRSTTIDGDIATIDEILKDQNAEVVRTRTDNEITALNQDRSVLVAEKQMFKTFINDMQKDANYVWVPGGVQANINAGTTFGTFCRDYLNVINTLEKSWTKKDGSKKGSGLKKKTAAQKPVVNTTPNLAQLEEQRQALLSQNRILKVPGKTDAVFTKHPDWNLALSILDGLRDEPSGAVMQKDLMTKTEVSAAPIVSSSQSDFEKYLAGLTQTERDQLVAALKEQLKANSKKSVETLQKVKRMQFSPSFLFAQAMNGVPGIFPIKTVNGEIDIPSLPIESLQGAIGGVGGMVSGGIEQAGNISTSMVMNVVQNAKDAALNVGAGAGLGVSSVPAISKGASFITNKTNTYGSVVSSKIASIKKTIEKPFETTQMLQGAQQAASETLKKYSTYLDELKTLSDENKKILADIATIEKVSAEGTVKKYTDAPKNKIDSTVNKLSENTKTSASSETLSKIGAAVGEKTSALVTMIDSTDPNAGTALKDVGATALKNIAANNNIKV